MVWGQVIAAQGELNSARALKEAAEVIGRSPTALKLRYLQTLNVIAAERGSTIIFPMAMDIMGTQVNRRETYPIVHYCQLYHTCSLQAQSSSVFEYCCMKSFNFVTAAICILHLVSTGFWWLCTATLTGSTHLVHVKLSPL